MTTGELLFRHPHHCSVRCSYIETVRVAPSPRRRTHREPVHTASRQSRTVAHGGQLQQSLERAGGSSGGGVQILRG